MLVIRCVTNNISFLAVNGISPPLSVCNSCVPKIISLAKPRLFYTTFGYAIIIPYITKERTMFFNLPIVLSIFERLIYVRISHYT